MTSAGDGASVDSQATSEGDEVSEVSPTSEADEVREVSPTSAADEFSVDSSSNRGSATQELPTLVDGACVITSVFVLSPVFVHRCHRVSMIRIDLSKVYCFESAY